MNDKNDSMTPYLLAGMNFMGSIGQSMGQQSQAYSSAANQLNYYNNLAFNKTLQAYDLQNSAALQDYTNFIESSRLYKKIHEFRGRQLTAFARQGKKLTGSALQKFSKDVQTQEFDLLMLNFSGQMKSIAMTRDAEIGKINANLISSEGRAKAEQAKIAGKNQALSSLVGGAFSTMNIFASLNASMNKSAKGKGGGKGA